MQFKKTIALYVLGTISALWLLSSNLNCNKDQPSPGQKSVPKAEQEEKASGGDVSRLSHYFPSVLLKDLNDKVVPTDRLLTGQNTVVIFISPSCEPCSDEVARWRPVVPNLEPPFQVIGISASPVAELVFYTKEQQINFPVYSDPSQALIEYFKISTYPTIVGVTPDRIVKFVRPGYSRSLSPTQYLHAF